MTRTLLRPLTAIKSSYAFIYAVEGAVQPFFAVYLATEHNLGPSQIGLALAIASVAGVVAPPVVTALADRFGIATRLLTLALLVSAGVLPLLSLPYGFWWILLVFTMFGLAREPTRPLLDGIFFSASRSRPELARVPFHSVRIWGTAGFMIPGIALYFAIGSQGDSLGFLPFIAFFLGLISLPLMWFLPSGPKPTVGGEHKPALSLRRTAKAAFRVISRKDTAIFLLAMFLLQTALTAYMAFYPLQATDVGLATRWLGPLTTLGVGLELFYMAAFGWFVKKLGWRWFMVLGSVTAALRMIALAAVPGIPALIGTQLVHGLVIVATMVGARALLDRQAGDDVRYTVQGLYAMIVMGVGKIVGNLVGGQLAAFDLATMFWAAAVISIVSAVLLAYALRRTLSIGN